MVSQIHSKKFALPSLVLLIALALLGIPSVAQIGKSSSGKDNSTFHQVTLRALVLRGEAQSHARKDSKFAAAHLVLESTGDFSLVPERHTPLFDFEELSQPSDFRLRNFSERAPPRVSLT